MTIMREKIIKDSDYIIVAGGKLEGFKGKIPGVLEEVCLGIEEKKPIYIIGYYEGVSKEIGNWKDEKNKEIMELYKSRHLSSYNRYGDLDGQVVFKVSPKKVSYWKYSSADSEPYREIFYIDRKMAERIEF